MKRLSRERTTLLVLQSMMKLEQSKTRAKTSNKVALETEKEKNAAEKAVEELKRKSEN